MSKSKKYYQIREYETFPKELTDSLLELQPFEVFQIAVKKGEFVITAKNYVGSIQLKDGTIIEILPKVGNQETVLSMLEALYELPYKTFKNESLGVSSLPLLELFIGTFLKEVEKVFKRGLFFDYTQVQENTNYLKGKLLVNQQMKVNQLKPHKFYVQYEEYGNNCAENRIVKTTLNFLLKKTKSEQNERKIRRFLKRLEGVSVSKNYKEDFSHCRKKLEHYQFILQWCEIFLDEKSFSIYSGTLIASALLFPMERLFESYMARKVRQTLPKERYRVVAQENKYHLFETPQPAFRLRPDIVVYDLQEQLVYILDTKWKILSRDKKNYGILSSDMYQIYAYQKRYQAEKVVLLYPQVEEEKLGNVYYGDRVEIIFVAL